MKTDRLVISLAIIVGASGLQNVHAQNPPPPKPTAAPVEIVSVPQISAELNKNLDRQITEVPREQREQAYAKLLEGQRYVWSMSRIRSQAGTAAGMRLARQAFQKAVELNPRLSEGYTALSELSLSGSPADMEEAIMLANIAVKINPDNFGAQRILARVYTIKSRIQTDAIEPVSTQKAINEWKEVTRLDPRNAEGWAFLSEFYNKTNKNIERIDALKKWLSAANPIDSRFYRTVIGGKADLSPESASLKLGSALIKANRSNEAVEFLSRAIADDPENTEAIELLRQAVDSGIASSSEATLQALQQAVFVNPTNLALIKLLAQVHVKMGQPEDAVKSLRTSVAKFEDSDKTSAADLQVFIGDIYSEANRTDEAAAAYEQALKTGGVVSGELVTDADREFAATVFNKLIQVYKHAGRINDAKAAIERARALLGNNDLFADRQIISLMRETGKSAEALMSVRALRNRMKEDYGLLRLEALILTEMGKVDEGVSLIKPLLGAGKTSSAPSLMFDDFSNYIFISSLYNQAKRGKDATSSAEKAYSAAGSEEKKQIANLTLASARQTSGDYKAAEEILRNLLKQSPNNPIALNNLGYFLLERDRKIEEALILIKKAVDIDPTNSNYLDSLGWAYFKLGQLGEAELYLKEAINNDSNSATIYEHLGDVYQKQGKNSLARKTWQKAMNLATDVAVNNRIKEKLVLRANQ